MQVAEILRSGVPSSWVDYTFIVNNWLDGQYAEVKVLSASPNGQQVLVSWPDGTSSPVPAEALDAEPMDNFTKWYGTGPWAS